MAMISLEFDDDKIFVAAARTAGKRTQINHLFCIDVQGSDVEVAAKLKSELAAKGLGRSDVIVVVSRSNAEVRLMDVPPAPDNELPDIVRFVARNEFASLNDNWLLDYVRLTGDQASTGQVLAAGVSPEMSNQIKSIVDESGLRLRHMVLRPFAAVDFMRERMTPNTVHLLVDHNDDQTDLTIVDGPDVVATRTVRISANNDSADQLVPEILRTVSSSSRALGGKPINQIIVFGQPEENEMLGEKLRSRMDSDVTFVSPLKHPIVGSGLKNVPHPTRYVALMGALAQEARKDRHSLDFLNPRKSVAPKSNASTWVRYGAIAAGLFLIAGLFGWWTLRSQSIENDALRAQVDELRLQNEGKKNLIAVKQSLDEVGKIDQWVLNETNWLEKLQQYSQNALTADETIVDVFTASAAGSRNEGRVSVTVRTSDFSVEQALIQSLSGDFQVIPSSSDTVEDDKEYPILSTLTLSLTESDLDLKAINAKAKEFREKLALKRQEEAKAKAGDAKPSGDEKPKDTSTGNP